MSVAAVSNERYEVEAEFEADTISQSDTVSAEPLEVSKLGYEVDFRSLQYVTDVDSNLICPICHSSFLGPVKLACDHIFCATCLSQALAVQAQGHKSCPTCRRSCEEDSVTKAPRILCQILDDLLVKCPLAERGCPETINRGALQTHTDFYCGFVDVGCPSNNCCRKIPRRFVDDPCMHEIIPCTNCGVEVMQCDMQEHYDASCLENFIACMYCQVTLQRHKRQEHLTTCPDLIISCPAAFYGCTYTGKRSGLEQHVNDCVMNKLMPFLETQRAQLADHEAALKHLQRKNSAYEQGLTNLRESLEVALLETPAKVSDSSTTSESTASHLLDLYESLRKEIDLMTDAISNLDAKTDMTFVNHRLRAREDMEHMNAAMGQLRMQIHWLSSSRLHAQQRTAALLRTQSTEAEPSVLQAINTRSTAKDNGSNAGLNKLQNLPVRRLSDPSRQETKL